MPDLPIPLRHLPGICLVMPGSNQDCYPTSRIQKGLVLLRDGQDLSEEGVGFGVPVLKIGREAVFPGSGVWKTELKGNYATIEADYSMNLVGRLAIGGRRIDCRTFYRAREWLASQYRRHPELRKGILYGAELSRMVMSMKDAFVEVPTVGSVKTVYSIMDDRVRVDLDLQGVPSGNEKVTAFSQVSRKHEALLAHGHHAVYSYSVCLRISGHLQGFVFIQKGTVQKSGIVPAFPQAGRQVAQAQRREAKYRPIVPGFEKRIDQKDRCHVLPNRMV